MHKVIFIGAGPGDPELITVKGQQILKNARVVLYTGSLVPKEVIDWAPENCKIATSQHMSYEEIFEFIEENIKDNDVIRVHTGDPSIYSTIAKQIKYLEEQNIPYEVIPGVTAAFGAAASVGIEYTIPGVSQTIILSKLQGKTPNPEALENLLNCKNSSHVFYLSVLLIDKLVEKALELGYSKDTPCWVVEKATWQDEKVIKSTLKDIGKKIQEAKIKKTALILFGEYLHQQETEPSHLYNKVSGS